VYDFVGILGPLSRDFHVVAPSVPGFGFSGPTTETGWGVNRIARAWAELMRRLGYDRYGAQGGDFGSIVSPELGRVAPEQVIGVHVNALVNASTPIDPGELDALSAAEREQAGQNQARWHNHSGYATQMSTRPQTLAYALNDSPAGQLAWNLEWFVDWDPTKTQSAPIDRDTILTNVTIFWLTATAGSAARLYLEAGAEAWGRRPVPSPVPTGVANFPGDGAIRGLAELSNNITRWTRYDRGGHFASLPGAGPAGIRHSCVLLDNDVLSVATVPRHAIPTRDPHPGAHRRAAARRLHLVDGDDRRAHRLPQTCRQAGRRGRQPPP
jgi:pimeloyl-ACP methyl ester carboxylesterase